MSAGSRLSHATVHVRHPGWGVAFASLVALSLTAYVLAPWSVEVKSIAILHGLCAQRPSHSFWFGPDRLPFGSRMTGIYSAFLITQIYLLLRGRFRASGIPSLAILVTLSVFIVAMGIDGINSTLNDVRLLTVYQPSNVLRYVTGALTGTTLAVFLWLLTSNILWHVQEQRSNLVVERFWELLILGAPITLFGLMAISDWRPLYPLLAGLLAVSAVLLMFELSICLIQLGRRRENSARTLPDLSSAAALALVGAYVFMTFLSGSRFLLEAMLQVKQLQ